MRRAYNIVTSTGASVMRMGLGTKVYNNVDKFKKPEKIISLYIKESCPFSRKVREGLSMLDIDANVRPCPIEGTRFRPELKAKGGKEQVPFLVDPNTGKQMYESQAILKYIYDEYGPGENKIPFLMKDGFVPTGSSRMATIMRSMPWHGLFQEKGNTLKTIATLIPKAINPIPHETHPIHPPVNKPIHLYSYEGSPNCRVVRETLDSLEIPYFLHNMARDSPKREEFKKMAGKLQFPYLVDENNNKKMFESQDIIDYLYANYRPKDPDAKNEK